MIWLLLTLLITSALISYWLQWRRKNRGLLEMSSQFPGPKTLPLFGNALQFMCQPEELITVIKNLITDYGDAMRFWLGPDLNIVISNPDDVKALLSNPKVSWKGPQYKYMADVLGGGILSGSGSTWRKHRKIAMPNYGKRAVESYTDTFNKEVDILLDVFRKVPAAEMCNIYHHVVRSTSYTVCQTLMGLTRNQTMHLPHIEEIIENSPRLYDIIFNRMTKWYLQIKPVFLLHSSYQEQKKFMKMINEFSSVIIEQRIEKLKTLTETHKVNLMDPADDSLSNTELSVIDRFILSQQLNDDELLKENFTVFTSSQEASAKMASFILLMMAYHPECQKKLYAEIKSVMGEEDRWISDEDIKQMPYLDMVFKEVLRLFPIGAMLQRTIHEDIRISSGTLRAGVSILAPIYHMHRDPRFWKNPEAFDPERFNPENSKQRHPNCYIPFSMGPMDCLGRYFGAKLIKTISVRVLREFELSSTESYKDLKLSIAISASSINGIHAYLKPRK